MKYSGVIYNDIAAAPGLSVSFFTQGCPHRCPGCQNIDTWAFDDGLEFTHEVLEEIILSLNKQGIQRNFCLMGGEPLCDENLFLSHLILSEVSQKSPNAKIYIWTGYTYEQLLKSTKTKVHNILALADYLIDGPYIAAKRDVTLEMRGSSNQKIIKFDK